MPIYEYKCNKCGRVYEELVLTPSHTEVTINCPDCKEVCEKQMSKSSFVVNGFNAKNNYSKGN
jgi:putative FmdB family regulatory protein